MVEIRHRMADIHHQNQPFEALATAQIGFQVTLPVLFEWDRHLGVAITGQVDQTAFVV
ncbi:hypothetical protein D9M73_218120 [compost metagenome]